MSKIKEKIKDKNQAIIKAVNKYSVTKRNFQIIIILTKKKF
jgi:hypothetical protein